MVHILAMDSSSSEPFSEEDSCVSHSSTETGIAQSAPATAGCDVTAVRVRVRHPRVLKSDIRRFFPVMWANVLNSQDSKFVHSFLATFATPDVKLQFKQLLVRSLSDCVDTNTAALRAAAQSLLINGCDNITNFFHFVHHVHPDEVVTVDNVRAFSFADGKGCTVRATLNITFTQVFETCAPTIAVQAFELEQQLAEEETALSKDTSRKRKRVAVDYIEWNSQMWTVNTKTSSIDAFFATLPTTSPHQLHVVLPMNMILDVNKRIQSIDFQQSVVVVG